MKRVDAVAVRRKIVRQVTFRIVAEVTDIELSVAIEDGFEFAREFGAAREPLVLWHFAEVEVSPRAVVVLGVRRFQK